MFRTTTRTVALSLAVLCASPVVTTEAHAAKAEKVEKELPQIEMTGITAFDSVFEQVKGIHDILDKAQGRLDGATNKIAMAVGLPEGSSMAMAMWELKQKAGGPIEVKMQGTKPVLTVGGNGGPEAQAAVKAVNEAVVEVAGLPQDLAQLPKQVLALVESCKALPGQLNPNLLKEAGMKPLDLPKVGKKLARNVKATAATPKRIEGVVRSAKGVLSGIPQGLKATEPPTEENLAKAKAEKKAKKSKKDVVAVAVADSVIGGQVSSAMTAFHDAEVQQALAILGQVDAELPKTAQPVPQQDLEELYQSQALVHLVSGNAAAATAAVAQALVVDPDAKPLDHLGPDYAKLHKLLSKADVLRQVEVPVQGSGNALISGQPVDASNGSVTLTAGRHLLQVEKGGTWTSQFVWVQDGFTLTL